MSKADKWLVQAWRHCAFNSSCSIPCSWVYSKRSPSIICSMLRSKTTTSLCKIHSSIPNRTKFFRHVSLTTYAVTEPKRENQGIRSSGNVLFFFFPVISLPNVWLKVQCGCCCRQGNWSPYMQPPGFKPHYSLFINIECGLCTHTITFIEIKHLLDTYRARGWCPTVHYNFN